MTQSSERFRATTTPLAGLVVLERLPLRDERGFLERLFCAETFARWGVAGPIAQINHTLTQCKGAVRGLHFQMPPHAETKVVSCLSGTIFDVAVDVRRGSSTFLKWHSEILSAENHRSLLIPPGFAHGFQALTDDCRLLYLHTAPHVPEAEAGLSAADPAVGVAWPLPLAGLSPRDRAWPPIAESFAGIAP